jgi:hypothetical protein
VGSPYGTAGGRWPNGADSLSGGSSAGDVGSAGAAGLWGGATKALALARPEIRPGGVWGGP